MEMQVSKKTNQREGEELNGKKWLEVTLTFYRVDDTMILISEVKSPVRS